MNDYASAGGAGLATASTLAYTGTNTWGFIAAVVVFTAVGSLMLRLGRRRKDASDAAA